MSGMWMMHRQGPDPEQNLTTTYVPGLDKLYGQTRQQVWLSSAATVLVSVATVAILWGRIAWWEIAIIVVLVLMVFFSAAVAGVFIGRLSAFKDLSRATVKVEHVHLHEGHEHD